MAIAEPPVAHRGSGLFDRKPTEAVVADTRDDARSLRRAVGALDLTALGIGAIIGTGIFVIIGEAIGDSGPAIVLAFVLAGLTCIFSALSYSELASAMVLEHYGLNPKKDVTYFSAGGAETSVQAMQQGIIQARAFNPDAAFILKKKGFTDLASLADIGAWPWAGYATTEAKLAQERDKIKRWTRAMVKSLQFMVNRREETIKIAMQEYCAKKRQDR